MFCTKYDSQITVGPVTGGTGVYTYAAAPNGDPAPTTYNNTPILTVDTVNGTILTWDVYVRDANGCVGIEPVTIVNDAAPTIVAPSAQCFVGTPIVIDLSLLSTVSVGPAQFYTVNGSTQTNPTYTITTAGTYNLSVTDANGCISNVVSYILRPQLTLQADMTQDLTCPVPASITLVPDGGITPYTTLEVNINNTGYNAIAGSPYTTSTAGTYKFRVTDSQGCQAESQDVIVTPNTTPTATTAFTNVSCIGFSDGTITLTPSGGNVAYEYSLDGVTYQSSNVFSGLGVGAYSIVVRDAKLCVSAPIPVSIGNPAALTATATVTPFGCDTANAPIDAVVTIIPTGGTGVYSYSINGGSAYQTSPSFTVNTAQTINYIVKDANGCTFPGSANVLPYTPPTDMDLTASPIYCSIVPAEATVTVNTVTGGVGPFVFEIISPATAMTAASAPTNTPYIFTNLAPDTYTIKVTDANGCSTTKAIVVEEADKIAVTAQLINNVYCTTDSTGIIEFTVTDYITPANYSFNLSPSLGLMTQLGDVIRYTGVPAGAYTFTVTDNTSGCVASVSNFAVTEPALALDFSSSATNTNCTTDEATITVTVSGGTLNYKYAVALATAGVPPSTAFNLSKTLTVDTNNGADMNWNVYVMDANGCSINKPQTILVDANPSNITVATYSECPDAITGTYTFTINPPTGVAPFTYSIGGGFQSSPTFVVNAPGSYDVTVMDANGCPTTETALVVIRQPLILTPVASIPVSCDGGDGQITVSATGGSGNYVYEIDGGGFALVTSFSNLASGPHRITVRDTTTSCEVYVDIDLQAATLITGFDLASTPVTCNGGFDGTITATMDTPAPSVNDNPVYTYTLTGTSITGAPINLGPQPSPLFSGLEASDSVGYTVVVTSGKGCDDTTTVIVDEPDPIVVPTLVPVQFGCTTGNADNLATITVDPTLITGGSGNYLNYEFIKVGTPTNTQVQFSTSNVYSEANLTGGSYIINVYDDKGCVGTNTATINPFIGIDFASPSAVTVTSPITCVNNEDIQVNATFTGGAAVPLDYSIVATATNAIPYVPVTNNSGQFSDLTVGSYIITVLNPATGCEIKTIHIVNDPNTFDLVASNIQNVVCFGTASGSVDITFVDNQLNPTDEAGAFEYTITDPIGTISPLITTTSASITIPNLFAGFYTIKAKLIASPSCEVETSFTVEGPISDLTLSVSETPISCDPGNDGSITATGDGGWTGSYQYELVGVTPGSVSVPLSYQFKFENLTSGTYNVNVHDTGGCIETVTVTLSNPTPIVFTASATASTLACNGDDNGEIVVNPPTGGQGSNYSYILSYISANPVFSSAPQTTPVFSGLSAGTYSVTIIDGLGCISAPSAIITIGEPTKVEAALVLASGITCLNDATVTLSATGGTGPYEYSEDKNFTVVLGSFASSTTFPVGLGDHQYYVRDANGCVSYISNNVAINALTPLSLSSLDLAAVYCKGSSTGVVDATALGGLGNYSYTLFDDVNNVVRPAQTSGYFDFLPAGKYIVRVDSGDCRFNSAIVEIVEPTTALSIDSSVKTDVTCTGEGNGKIVITASGGTGKITYAISPNLNQTFEGSISGGHVFDNLKPGSYDYIVQDENGCYIYTTGVVITEPNSIIVTTIPGTEIPEVCAGDADGAFSINITGGSAPYSVSLDDVNGTYTLGIVGQTQFDFANLSGSEHIVYVRDTNNCTSEHTVILGEAVTLNPKATVNYDCVNNSASNSVTVTVDASNLPADLDYALDGSTTFQASNVFTNLTAGRHTIDVRHTNGCIKQVVFDILQVDPLTLTLADGGLNEIVATATGGGGNYQYTLDGESYGNKSNFIIYKSGDYTVTVTDVNGCTATATRYFEFIDIKIPNVFTPNGDGNNDTWAPTNTINYKDLVFDVFDRYGRKLGSYREGQFWDGKYNGTELPSGDYWYVIKIRDVKDAREFVGHFTLYR
ncbi:MAG: T9SS type B sorting domain-containing protein [Flavobacterium sp.]|nr:T9SS type B sorting domain-containing protein [Flavobacterium sp.]